MMAPIVVLLFAAFTGSMIWKRNGDKQLFRERGWALIILIIGTLLIIAMQFRIPVPNPTDWISAIFTPMSKPITKWVEEDIKN
jgi:amino acid transporter